MTLVMSCAVKGINDDKVTMCFVCEPFCIIVLLCVSPFIAIYVLTTVHSEQY